jgi:hypothetical protein
LQQAGEIASIVVKDKSGRKLADLRWNSMQYYMQVHQKLGSTYYDVNIIRTPLNAVPCAFAAQKVVEKQVLSVKGDTLFKTSLLREKNIPVRQRKWIYINTTTRSLP